LGVASVSALPQGGAGSVATDAGTPVATPQPLPSGEAVDSTPLKPGEMVLCGLGRRMGTWKPVDTSGNPVVADTPPGQVPVAQAPPAPEFHWDVPAEVSEPVVQALMNAMLRKMATSGDVRQRAAALELGFQGNSSATTVAQLVQLAQASADPWVMLWAQRACMASQPDAACAGFSVRQWLRVAPDNVMAWLALMNQEPAALEEALHGMSLATRADPGFMRVVMPLDQMLTDQVPAYLAIAVLDRAMLHEAPKVIVNYSPLLQACSLRPLTSANRRQVCQAIGKTMVDTGTDMVVRRVGAALLQRLDNDPRRGEAMKALGDAVSRKLITDIFSDQPYSCAVVARRRSYLQNFASQGEWVAMEDLARAGR
jgi:hypothetical protein